MKSRAHGPLALLHGAAVALTLALAPAQGALAQDSAQMVEAPATIAAADAAKQDRSVRTMRTGSNILRVRTDESLPLMEIDRAYIERTGANNTPDLLRTIPQIQIGR
jgi:outer membrane cobalamin receptor